jgi:hypothetical protein
MISCGPVTCQFARVFFVLAPTVVAKTPSGRITKEMGVEVSGASVGCSTASELPEGKNRNARNISSSVCQIIRAGNHEKSLTARLIITSTEDKANVMAFTQNTLNDLTLSRMDLDFSGAVETLTLLIATGRTSKFFFPTRTSIGFLCARLFSRRS